jgi:peptidoglycan/LPS O-acetylase OafA/YrhL
VTTEAPVARNGRVVSLDGLRGIAALVVVVHHVLILSSPPLADAYLRIGRRDTTSAAWWLTYTPLHLAWAGGEAVLVFFVLSGFVLCWPLANGRTMDWLAYYPKRLLRLYLPVWGALLVAVVLALLVHRHHVAGGTWVVNVQSPLSWRRLADDASLLVGDVGQIDGPLWSLRWEVVFSLALPAFVAFGLLAKRLLPVKLVLLCLVIFFGSKGGGLLSQTNPYLLYLPMFGFGVLLAFHGEQLRRTVDMAARSRAFWPVSGAAAVAFLLARWWPVHAVRFGRTALLLGRPLTNLLAVIGAAWIVVMFWHCAPLVRAASSRTGQWLGVRSFSLYLTHAPIIIAVVLVAPRMSTPLLLLAVPLCLAAASAFFFFVEGPAHRLSQHVGRRVTARSAPLPTAD